MPEQNTSKGQIKKKKPCKIYHYSAHLSAERVWGVGVGWEKVGLWHIEGSEEERTGEMTNF